MQERLRLTVTGAVGIAGRILSRRYVDQLTRSRDVLGYPRPSASFKLAAGPIGCGPLLSRSLDF
jgi:hypothetical protein